jgi:adenosylcobinamide-GDP ribazoletransferase
MLKRILLAFQFCTIVPIRVSGDVTEKDVAASAVFFPLVGAFQGLVTAVTAFLLIKVFPSSVAAGFALACLILTNGGFTLDGLADTFDGLAVKSSGDADTDRARRLSVMKESTAGAIGVISLVLAILLKFVLMDAFLSEFPTPSAAALLFLMPVFSKWVNVPVMHHAKPARKDGLGRIFVGRVGPGAVAVSTGIVVLVVLLMLLINPIGGPCLNMAALCMSFCVALYILSFMAVTFLTKRFGGLTGDHFGALAEVSEVLFLLAAYPWLRDSF